MSFFRPGDLCRWSDHHKKLWFCDDEVMVFVARVHRSDMWLSMVLLGGMLHEVSSMSLRHV